jgi:ribosomal protein S18 acetylase RimI-like enzyme
MLTYRPFRNTDPPALAALWRSRAGQPGLFQPISLDLLEQLVFAKLYFDYDGLLLACADGQPVGFAHAGFGPNAERTWTSTEAGAACMLLVRPDCAEAEVAGGLLDRCEEYLRGRGARVLYGGGLSPINPFYLGLYGGSELPGVLDSDTTARQIFAARGYQETERTSLLRRELSGFESLMSRQQMQLRRQVLVEVTVDVPTRNWWEASVLGEFDLTRFDLLPRTGGAPIATAMFRNMEPNGMTSASRAMGLVEITVAESHRRRGLAVFLLSEAFRQFVRQGILHVEVQIRQTDAAALELYRKFGFQQVDQGGMWRKDA